MYCEYTCARMQVCAKLHRILKKNSIGRNNLLIGRVSIDLSGDIFYVSAFL